MNFRPVLTAIVLLIGLTVAAEAAELFTPPLTSYNGVFRCQAVNVSGRAQNIKTEFLDYLGSTLAYAGPYSIPPGNVLDSAINAPASPSIVYCKITADGGAKSVRGALSAYSFHDQNSPSATVPAQ